MQCPVCKKHVESFHPKSHLIPEWMYKDCYEENHKALAVITKEQKIFKKQKGIYDSIICGSCEGESQIFDHYASLILTNNSPQSEEYLSIKKTSYSGRVDHEITEYSIWENINFMLLQRFAFGIMLRAHFAEEKKGRYLLIDRHLNKVLNIYRDQTIIDDFSYPIIFNKYPEGDILNHHVLLPIKKVNNGHRVIEFSAAGYCINIYVSN